MVDSGGVDPPAAQRLLPLSVTAAVRPKRRFTQPRAPASSSHRAGTRLAAGHRSRRPRLGVVERLHWAWSWPFSSLTEDGHAGCLVKDVPVAVVPNNRTPPGVSSVSLQLPGCGRPVSGTMSTTPGFSRITLSGHRSRRIDADPCDDLLAPGLTGPACRCSSRSMIRAS